MKRSQQILALAVTVLSLALAAGAQSVDKAAKANVPFEFIVAGHTFPAGEYSFISTAPNVLHVRDARGHNLLTAVTGTVEAPATPPTAKLHFRTEGSQHFLVRIWQDGNRSGQELYISKQDVELAKQQNVQSLSSARAR